MMINIRWQKAKTEIVHSFAPSIYIFDANSTMRHTILYLELPTVDEWARTVATNSQVHLKHKLKCLISLNFVFFLGEMHLTNQLPDIHFLFLFKILSSSLEDCILLTSSLISFKILKRAPQFYAIQTLSENTLSFFGWMSWFCDFNGLNVMILTCAKIFRFSS